MKFVYSLMFVLITSFINSPLVAQSECYLSVANEKIGTYQFRKALDIRQDTSGVEWTLSDTLSLQVVPGDTSSVLTFSNFNALIQENSVVKGLRINVVGEASDLGIVDNIVRFVTPDSTYSLNYANQVTIGSSWTQSRSAWRYGGFQDNWDLEINRDMLNSDDFSVQLQVNNAGDSTINVNLYALEFIFLLQEPYPMCPDHRCMIVHLPNTSLDTDFDWILPDGFETLDMDNDPVLTVQALDVLDSTYLIQAVNRTTGDTCRRYVEVTDCLGQSIGDTVFEDLNNNGVQDEDEQGIPNVFVVLRSANNQYLQSTVTDTDGHYQFDEIDNGVYRITTSHPMGYQPTYLSAYSDEWDDIGSQLFVVNSADRLDLDFGLSPVFSATGTVYVDNNRDGSYNDSDSTYAMGVVEIYSALDTLVAIDSLDGNGGFSFTNLTYGDYYFQLTGVDTSHYAAAVLNDNILTQSNGHFISQVITLTQNEAYELGIQERQYTVGGYVWLENDKNGQLDETDERFGNVTIGIYDEANTLIETSDVLENGEFSFENITYGFYYINLIDVDTIRYQPTILGQNMLVTVEGNYQTNTLLVDESETVYLGLQLRSYDLSGRVFVDLNRDGLFDVDDSSYNQSTVSLLDASDSLISTIDVELDGSFVFESINYGDYKLLLNTVDAARYEPTVLNPNILTLKDGLFESESIQLMSDTDVELGLHERQYNINGYVWFEEDANGLFDGYDTPINQYRVGLFNQDGELITSTSDLLNGQFEFDAITYGYYYAALFEVDQMQYTPTLINDNMLTDVNGEYQTASVLVDSETTFYLGLQLQRYDLTGRVYLDENMNGEYDDSENGVTDVSVRFVATGSGTVDNAAVLPQGYFAFNDHPYGEYIVSIPNLDTVKYYPTIESPLSLIDGVWTTDDILLGSDKEILLGLQLRNYAIDVVLWEDVNEDGIYQDEEPLVEGLDVSLTSEDYMATMLSQSQAVQFDELLPMTYTVNVNLDNTNWIPTVIGLDNSLAGDNGVSVNLVKDTLVYIGLVEQKSSISGVTWLDENVDGIKQSQEPMLTNLEVTLLDCDNNVITTTVSDNQGNYSFTELMLGQYSVQFETVDTMAFTPTSSEISPNAFGRTECINLTAEPLDAINAGYVNLGSITGMIYDDYAANNSYEDIDKPLADITVELFNEQDDLIDATKSDSLGNYRFDYIVPGSYQVVFKTGLPQSRFTQSDTIIWTYATSIVYNQVVTDVDASVYFEGKISGIAYLDVNEDGLQSDIDEVWNINDIQLSLYDADLNLLSEQSTSQGGYNFSGLRPGKYSLKANIPDGYLLAEYQVGDNQNIDFDFTEQNGSVESAIRDIYSGTSIVNIDLGLTEIVTSGVISGYIFEDNNANGLNDVNDTPISNIEIRVIDESGTTVATVTSNDDGVYQISNIPFGEYTLVANPQDIWKLTISNVGGNDSDYELVDGSIQATFMHQEDSESSYDLGLFRQGIIAGTVWYDRDENGLFVDENPLPSFEIELYDQSGSLVATSISDDDGHYMFEVNPGDYNLKIITVGGQTVTVPNVGEENMINSNFDTETNRTDNISITSGLELFYINAGIIAPPSLSSISGIVWEDVNANGLYDIGETLSNGVDVQLTDSNSQVVKSIATNASGEYTFDELPEGIYRVKFVNMPQNLNMTISNVGTNPMIDSDVDDASNEYQTNTITLSEQDVQGINFGYYYYASIGDYVWNDENNDGLQQTNESGIANVALSLFTSSGNFVSTERTDASGYYRFNLLAPGNYYAVLSLDAGLSLTTSKQGNNDLLDSDFNQESNTTQIITLISGQAYNDLDAGLRLDKVQIGNRVWVDVDGDAQQSEGDYGLNDVNVYLYNQNDELIAQTQTAKIDGVDGVYSFDSDRNGLHYIRFSPLENYEFVTPYQGNNSAYDSDVTNAKGSGTTDLFELTPGIANNDIDAGVFVASEISGVVWHDENKNGVNDFETGMLNVKVELYDAELEKIATTSTVSGGEYRFGGLNAGDYFVRFIPIEGYEFTIQKADEQFGNDANAFGNTDMITLSYAEEVTDVNAGIVITTGFIGDLVWHDRNANGLQDNGEEGLSNVKIELYGNNNVVTTYTDVFGRYQFNGLVAGEYRLRFYAPDGYQFSPREFGFDTSVDSDVDIIGYSRTYYVDADNLWSTVDCGLYMPGRMSAMVWYDADMDGLKDFDESMLSNCMVKLYDANDQFVSEKATDGQMTYFDDLKPGDYYMTFESINKHMKWESSTHPTSEKNGVFTSEMIHLTENQSMDAIQVGLSSTGMQRVEMDVYPNPFTDKVNLTFSNHADLENDEIIVRVYDMTGGQVKEANISDMNNVNVVMADLDGGIYQLVVVAYGYRFEKHIIKID